MRPFIAPSIALLAVLLLVACGSGGGDDGGNESTPVALADLNRLCDFLPDADVAALIGEPMEGQGIGGPAPETDEPVDEPTLGYVGGNCLYLPQSPESIKNVVVFAWTKGADFEPAPGAPEEVRDFCDERAGVGSRVPAPEPVDGIGEYATQHDEGGLFAVVDEVCLSVWVSIETESAPAGEAEEREIERELADLLIPRLRGE